MNIESLIRELSGHRPLRRVVDIVSKPARIWDPAPPAEQAGEKKVHNLNSCVHETGSIT